MGDRPGLGRVRAQSLWGWGSGSMGDIDACGLSTASPHGAGPGVRTAANLGNTGGRPPSFLEQLARDTGSSTETRADT